MNSLLATCQIKDRCVGTGAHTGCLATQLGMPLCYYVLGSYQHSKEGRGAGVRVNEREENFFFFFLQGWEEGSRMAEEGCIVAKEGLRPPVPVFCSKQGSQMRPLFYFEEIK